LLNNFALELGVSDYTLGVVHGSRLATSHDLLLTLLLRAQHLVVLLALVLELEVRNLLRVLGEVLVFLRVGRPGRLRLPLRVMNREVVA